jgi:hypothetical protein
MDFLDTFNENGVFMSAEDYEDVHYKGLWHKVIRVWLYDKEGNLFLRVRKKDHKCDFINEVHMISGESATSAFDRGMFEKLGIHLPATSTLLQTYTKKIKRHKVYSDNTELKDNYFLCDYIGEFDKSTNFFIFSEDTEKLVKCNAKGILNLLKNRTGEVLSYTVEPNGKVNEKTEFVKITDIYEDNSEDTYAKYNFVVNAIETEMARFRKEERENEKLAKLSKKVQEEQSNDYTSHADDNEGIDIY